MDMDASHLRYRQDIDQVCTMIHEGPWRVNRRMVAVLLRAFPDWLATNKHLRDVILERWSGGVETVDPSWPPAPATELPAVIHEPRGPALLAILECAKSRPAGEGGDEFFDAFNSEWLAITLAARFGIKGSAVERIRWVHQREAQWRRIAADPLASTEWASAGNEPEIGSGWPALAAVLEWADYRENGSAGFVSHLPINIAIRDLGDHDASRSVLRRLRGELIAYASGSVPARGIGPGDAELARWWLNLCADGLPRSLVAGYLLSQPSMPGRVGASVCLRSWLCKNDPTWPGRDASQDARVAWGRLNARRLAFLAGLLSDIVAEFPVVVPAVNAWAAVSTLAGKPYFGGHEFKWRTSPAPAPEPRPVH